MVDVSEFWGTHTLSPDTLYQGRIGLRRLWLQQRLGDTWIANQETPEEPSAEPPTELAEGEPGAPWARWLGQVGPVTFLPVLPDRPVVVRPTEAVRIPRGVEVTLYVALPLWVRARIESDPPGTLSELPTRVLTNTWFGDPASGELCYALRSDVARLPDGVPPTAWDAVCPVVLTNASSDPFAFDRLCVHAELLGVFAGQSRLWTNAVEVVHRGDGRPQAVQISNRPPEGLTGEERITEPRTTVKKGVLQMSVSLLRSMTGWE